MTARSADRPAVKCYTAYPDTSRTRPRHQLRRPKRIHPRAFLTHGALGNHRSICNNTISTRSNRGEVQPPHFCTALKRRSGVRRTALSKAMQTRPRRAGQRSKSTIETTTRSRRHQHSTAATAASRQPASHAGTVGRGMAIALSITGRYCR